MSEALQTAAMPRSIKLSLLIIWILVPAILTQVPEGDEAGPEHHLSVSADVNVQIQVKVEITINCVSGNMSIQEQSKGIIPVSQLSDGDFIRGISGPDSARGWCRVEAVSPRSEDANITTYDGFTADHMVVDDGLVHQYGKKGELIKGRLYNVVTECDAAVNAAGQAFTPISTAFCPHDLEWSEYLILMAAIRRVTDRTGFFWYLNDAFHDNDTAHIPLWKDMLHEMCLELLNCARDGKCQQFENWMAEFIREHVNQKYLPIVKDVFPNMGGDVTKEEAGTISETVRPKGMRSIMFMAAVGSAIAGFMLILLVAAILYRKKYCRGIKKMQDPQANHPQVDCDDGKA